MEKEARYRRLIAACSRVPLTLVDQQLDTLTTAVESDGDALDLERVEDFLRNLSTASTAARSQPFYDSQQSTTKLDDLSQASTTLPSMTELASTAELPLVKDGDLIEEDHISTDALIPIDPSSPTIELAVKEEDTNTIFTPMETS
ncbi:hypothetical protein BDF19DRAFT_446640 [Syncephalis fuscata]|nr:hypothetical protein BDF19DRAFT_446640 [Syncephalis fuscata]